MSTLQRVPHQYHEKLQAQIVARVLRDHGQIMLDQTAFWITWVDGDDLKTHRPEQRTALLANLIGCPPIPAGYRRLYSYYTCYYGEGARFLEYIDIPAHEVRDGAFDASLNDETYLEWLRRNRLK